jgi:uncharacterized protein
VAPGVAHAPVVHRSRFTETATTGPAVDRLEVRPDVGSAAWISCAGHLPFGHLPFGQPGDQREDDAWSVTYD